MLGIDLTQILLHLFNTALLFADLYFLLYKPVLAFMKKREEYYRDMDQEATRRLEEAKTQEAAYQEKISALETEIDEKRQQAVMELDQERENRMAEARSEAEKILGNAREDAKEERAHILDSVRGDITLMVEEATQKIILSPTVTESYDRFLEGSEAEGSAVNGEN